MIWLCCRCSSPDITSTPLTNHPESETMKRYTCEMCGLVFGVQDDGLALHEALNSPRPRRRQM